MALSAFTEICSIVKANPNVSDKRLWSLLCQHYRSHYKVKNPNLLFSCLGLHLLDSNTSLYQKIAKFYEDQLPAIIAEERQATEKKVTGQEMLVGNTLELKVDESNAEENNEEKEDSSLSLPLLELSLSDSMTDMERERHNASNPRYFLSYLSVALAGQHLDLKHPFMQGLRAFLALFPRHRRYLDKSILQALDASQTQVLDPRPLNLKYKEYKALERTWELDNLYKYLPTKVQDKVFLRHMEAFERLASRNALTFIYSTLPVVRGKQVIKRFLQLMSYRDDKAVHYFMDSRLIGAIARDLSLKNKLACLDFVVSLKDGVSQSRVRYFLFTLIEASSAEDQKILFDEILARLYAIRCAKVRLAFAELLSEDYASAFSLESLALLKGIKSANRSLNGEEEEKENENENEAEALVLLVPNLIDNEQKALAVLCLPAEDRSLEIFHSAQTYCFDQLAVELKKEVLEKPLSFDMLQQFQRVTPKAHQQSLEAYLHKAILSFKGSDYYHTLSLILQCEEGGDSTLLDQAFNNLNRQKELSLVDLVSIMDLKARPLSAKQHQQLETDLRLSLQEAVQQLIETEGLIVCQPRLFRVEEASELPQKMILDLLIPMLFEALKTNDTWSLKVAMVKILQDSLKLLKPQDQDYYYSGLILNLAASEFGSPHFDGLATVLNLLYSERAERIKVMDLVIQATPLPEVLADMVVQYSHQDAVAEVGGTGRFLCPR